MRLYHGTSEKGWSRAQREGALMPLDAKAVAKDVARFFDIGWNKIYEHEFFSFAVQRLRTGPHLGELIYFAPKIETSESYARSGGSEAYIDAIKSAMLIKKEPAFKESANVRIARVMEKIVGKPMMLELEVGPDRLRDGELDGFSRFSDSELARVIRNRTAVTLRAPVPVSLVVRSWVPF